MTAAVCPSRSRIAALLSLRQRGDLGRAGRQELLLHLGACDACREDSLAADPTLLFLPLAGAAAGQDRASEPLGPAVMAAITLVRREKGLARVQRRTYLRLAAAFVGLSLLAAWAVRTRVRPEAPLAEAARAAAPVPVRRDPLPPIEGVGSPDARVYQFTASGEPTVVFVVDRNADI